MNRRRIGSNRFTFPMKAAKRKEEIHLISQAALYEGSERKNIYISGFGCVCKRFISDAANPATFFSMEI